VVARWCRRAVAVGTQFVDALGRSSSSQRHGEGEETEAVLAGRDLGWWGGGAGRATSKGGNGVLTSSAWRNGARRRGARTKTEGVEEGKGVGPLFIVPRLRDMDVQEVIAGSRFSLSSMPVSKRGWNWVAGFWKGRGWARGVVPFPTCRRWLEATERGEARHTRRQRHLGLEVGEGTNGWPGSHLGRRLGGPRVGWKSGPKGQKNRLVLELKEKGGGPI
jgi:hypothetical protein